MATYDPLQSDYELYLDIDGFSGEIEISADYNDKIRVPRIAASKLFLSPIQNDDKKCVNAASNKSGSHVDVNLPKLNLICLGVM